MRTETVIIGAGQAEAIIRAGGLRFEDALIIGAAVRVPENERMFRMHDRVRRDTHDAPGLLRILLTDDGL